MRFLISLFLVLSINVQAEELYSSVGEYIKHVTAGNSDGYQCFITSINSNYKNTYQDCKLEEMKELPKNLRIFGIISSPYQNPFFAFILETTKNGKIRLVENSVAEDLSYAVIDSPEVIAESNEKFKIKFSVHRGGIPTFLFYHIQQIKNQWRVINVDFDEAGWCGEGDDRALGNGRAYSINFITGKTKEGNVDFKKCEELKWVNKPKKKYPVVLFSGLELSQDLNDRIELEKDISNRN